jgi:hypothetical protein
MNEHPATTLLNTLFAPGDWVELRSLISDKSSGQQWVQLRTSDLSQAWTDLAADTQRSHYFGANPRRARGGTKAKDVPLARCVFADFDPEGDGETAYANRITVADAQARIDEAGLPYPTAIVRTPKGVHAYWRLEKPISDLAAWNAMQKAIIQRLRSDRSVHDAPRLMRLPGFACRKPLAEGRVTELVEVDAERVYALEEFPSALCHQTNTTPARSLDVLVPLADGREVPEHTRWVLERATPEQLHRGQAKGRRGELYHQAVHLTRLGWSLPDVQQVIRRAAERLGLHGFDLHDLVSRQVQNACKHGRDNPVRQVERGAPAEEVLPWQPFPVAALPPVVREMVEAAAPAAQVDPAMAAGLALGVLAGALGRTRLLTLNPDFIVPPMLWIAVVCQSGNGKTPCLNKLRPALLERETQLQAANQGAMERFAHEKRAHEEAMVQRRKAKGPPGEPPSAPKRPPLPRMTVDNITMEALISILRDNPAGVFGLYDELAGFVGGFDQYRSGGKGSDATHYLRMYDGDAITVDRKTEGSIHVPVAALSVLGGIQPGPLRRLLGPSTAHGESGLLARFMVMWPPELPKRRFQRSGMDAGVQDRFANLIRRLCDQREGIDPLAPTKTVKLSDGAAEMYAEFYSEHDADYRNTTGALRSALVKLLGGCARLALLDHEVRVQLGLVPTGELQPESMKAAITITRWWRHETRRIYAEMHQQTDQEGLNPLVEFLRRHPDSTAAEVARGIHRYRGRVQQAEGDLLRLEARGQVQQRVLPPGDRGGPATTRWSVAAPITITTTPTKAEESEGSGDGDAVEGPEWTAR